MPDNFQYLINFAGKRVYETAFNRCRKEKSEIISFSFGEKGIIALFKDGGWAWTEVTKYLDNTLRGRQITLPKPVFVATDTGHWWYIQFANGIHKWRAHSSFTNVINNSKVPVKHVTFGARNSWCIIFKDDSFVWNEVPQSLHKILEEKKKYMVKIKFVSISPHEKWFVAYEDGTWDAELPPMCRKIFKTTLNNNSIRINNLWLGKRGMYCIQYKTLDTVHLSQEGRKINRRIPCISSGISVGNSYGKLNLSDVPKKPPKKHPRKKFAKKRPIQPPPVTPAHSTENQPSTNISQRVFPKSDQSDNRQEYFSQILFAEMKMCMQKRFDERITIHPPGFSFFSTQMF